jgi:hypothetical protein
MAQQDRIYGEVILNRAEYERTGIALTTTPGGTCAFCGTAIKALCQILSADGKRFHVGCDCVNKVNDNKLVSAVKLAIRKADKVKRAAKSAAVEAELAAILADEAQRARLAALPHPRGYDDSNLLNFADFMSRRAGAAGKARALKAIKVTP